MVQCNSGGKQVIKFAIVSNRSQVCLFFKTRRQITCTGCSGLAKVSTSEI